MHMLMLPKSCLVLLMLLLQILVMQHMLLMLLQVLTMQHMLLMFVNSVVPVISAAYHLYIFNVCVLCVCCCCSLCKCFCSLFSRCVLLCGRCCSISVSSSLNGSYQTSQMWADVGEPIGLTFRSALNANTGRMLLLCLLGSRADKSNHTSYIITTSPLDEAKAEQME